MFLIGLFNLGITFLTKQLIKTGISIQNIDYLITWKWIDPISLRILWDDNDEILLEEEILQL